MINITRHHLVCVAIAALGLVGAAAVHAQNAPAPQANTPAVEQPEAPASRATPPGVERPDETAVEATREAAENTPDADDDDIVWTRDRPRDRIRFNGRFRGNGSGDELVSVGGNSILNAGQRSDAVVSIFGSSTSSGEVRDSVVSVFGNTRVEGGYVGQAAVAVLGDNYVNSTVDGEVVAVLGNVELGPKARVRGDVVVIGGLLKRDPASEIRGGVQNIMGLPQGALVGIRSWLENCLRYLRPLAFADGLGWAWTLALGFLALYALLGLMFRDPVDRCVKTLQDHPGQTIVASLLTMLLTPVLFTILAITIIGVPFIPIVSFVMFLGTLLGKAAVLAWIGRAILKSFDEENKLNTAIAVLTGGVVILLLYVVPVLGFLIYNILGLLALGVVVYTLLLAARARRRSSPPPSIGARPSNDAPAGAAPYAAGFTADAMSPNVTDAAAGGGGASSGGGSGTATGGGGDGGDFGSGGNGAPSGGGGPPVGGSGPTGTRPTISAAEALTLPRAGFWIRMLALMIDAILVGVAFALLDHNGKLQLVALAAYGAIMWKLKGTTVGGIVCNLKVIRVDGREIDWSTAIVRALGCFLSLVVCGLGFIWIAFDEGRQSWHDKLAGTAVVRVPQGVSLL
jgi:uncharacterized RDD family membrane protein YckC/uncharacterized membrane protein YgcG